MEEDEEDEAWGGGGGRKGGGGWRGVKGEGAAGRERETERAGSREKRGKDVLLVHS